MDFKERQLKNEMSTGSSEEDKYQSSLRMIQSTHLTPEMAVNYLYQWRTNNKLLIPLLERIQEFCLKTSLHYLPTVIFIMSLEENPYFQRFCQNLTNASLPMYLLIRWSYSTYMQFNRKQAENMLNKIDYSIMKKNQLKEFQNVTKEQEKIKIHQKYMFTNYILNINDFFERLFKIPEKLKKYEKPKRNQKLREYLEKCLKKVTENQTGCYLPGITFPLESKSNITVNILTKYCFTFSTKERVPFKIVFETLSVEDSIEIKSQQKVLNQKQKYQAKIPEKLSGEQKISDKEQESLMLPHTYFGMQWKLQRQKIFEDSKYSNLASYEIKCYMVKSGDDLRQQYMAMQLIKLIKQIIIKQNLKLWIRPYDVIPFDSDSGLIQFIDDTRTVSYLKEMSRETSLKVIYKQLFGDNWETSISHFVESLAGYSLIQYLFQIKDRHNNNILIDVYGHIIHIDFSFIISSSPGNMNFEKAPFKLTKDYVQIMEGEKSDIFKHFKLLFFLGLKYLRKYQKEIMESILMMQECQSMKCFIKFDRISLEKRFHSSATDQQLQKIVDTIIKNAIGSYTTGQYDTYQWYTNQIYT